MEISKKNECKKKGKEINCFQFGSTENCLFAGQRFHVDFLFFEFIQVERYAASFIQMKEA